MKKKEIKLPECLLDYDIILAIAQATPGLKVKKSYRFPLILGMLHSRYQQQRRIAQNG